MTKMVDHLRNLCLFLILFSNPSTGQYEKVICSNGRLKEVSYVKEGHCIQPEDVCIIGNLDCEDIYFEDLFNIFTFNCTLVNSSLTNICVFSTIINKTDPDYYGSFVSNILLLSQDDYNNILSEFKPKSVSTDYDLSTALMNFPSITFISRMRLNSLELPDDIYVFTIK